MKAEFIAHGMKFEVSPTPAETNAAREKLRGLKDAGIEITFTARRLWYAPVALAWLAAGMVTWWQRPVVFLLALITFARER